jgi:murein DD-endopeptidase MepM/ murein hydrolase activator NlpD
MAGRALFLFLIIGALFIGVLPCAFPQAAAAASGDGGWRWPLRPAPPRVVRGFDPPTSPWGSGHRGVDLAAKVRQPVYAAAAGRVGFAGRLAGRGVVTVIHGPLRTTYLPVSPRVRRGQRVTAGRRIGVMEDSLAHCGGLNCLHWGLLQGIVYLDPLSLFGGRVRLLPVWGLPGANATGAAPTGGVWTGGITAGGSPDASGPVGDGRRHNARRRGRRSSNRAFAATDP